MSVAEIRNAVELLVLIVVALIGAGRLLQRRDSEHAAEQDFLGRELKNIENRFEQANKEMSRLASFVQGLDVRWRQEFVTRDVCDARMGAIQREMNGDRSRGNP